MSSIIYKPVAQKFPLDDKVQRSSSVDVRYEMDTRCGFWMCKPAFMQPLAKIGVFTTFNSFVALMTQTLTVYVNSQVTTLERQFGFSSRQIGIILAANEVGYLACVLFVAYLATRTHIPRFLGIATIAYGLSGIACSLPHFLFGASTSNDPTSASVNSTASNFSKQSAVVGSLCDVFNNTEDPCEIVAGQTVFHKTTQTASEKVAEISLVIIIIGMALQGFAKAPRSSFSVIYIDDNTAKVNTGFYSGIMISAAVLGPVVAFLVGGVFSRMYVTLEATELTPRHPRWIGAWWLGFVVFGVLSLIVCIPLFCFPRKMPRCKAKNVHVDNEATTRNPDLTDLDYLHTQAKQINEDKTLTSHSAPISRRVRFKSLLQFAKDFLATLYRLIINPVYVCLVISCCFSMFMTAGNSSFMPKYMERMFHLQVHTANYIIAGILLCTSFVGSLAGGALSKRFKMTAMTGMQFIIVMVIISVVFQFLAFIFQCDQPTVYNLPGEENTCNSGCNCRDNSYFPICGGDGRTYYSPCHAGCLQAEQEIYQNCSCIPGGHAIGGTCDYGCSHLYGYVAVVAIRTLSFMLGVVPNLVVFIRCVPESDRSMAISVFPFMASLFGWLLAPMFYGNFIDNACLIWDIKCLTRGRCLLYDNNLFRIKFHGYGALGLVFSLVFLLIAYLYARWSKCLDAGAEDDIVLERTEMQPVVNIDDTINT